MWPARMRGFSRSRLVTITARQRAPPNFTYKNRGRPSPRRCRRVLIFHCCCLWVEKCHFCAGTDISSLPFRAKLEKMPSIPEEPEVPENEVERFTMPDFIKPLYDLDVIEGKEAVLKCKVAGLPYPTIVWFHNGKRIESTEDRKMTQCKWINIQSMFRHSQSY